MGNVAGGIMNPDIGWVTMEVKCPYCEYEHVFVAPFDTEMLQCPECDGVARISLTIEICNFCIRQYDPSITGDYPCPICGVPIFQDERIYA
jgi:DNA-directed RNA polymerase subunit RPC12/RpoP